MWTPCIVSRTPCNFAGLLVSFAGLLVSFAGLLVSLAGLLVRDDFCYKRLAILLDIKHSNITRNLLSSCHGNIMEADNERDREGNNEGERINRL